MDRATFITRLDQIKAVVSKLDAKIYSWEIGEPASVEIVCAIEKKYKIKLPTDFVEMITKVAGKVNIIWSVHENKSFRKQHPQFRELSSGVLRWDIEHYLSEIFCERPQNLVKQRISPHFLTKRTPNYYEFTTKE